MTVPFHLGGFSILAIDAQLKDFRPFVQSFEQGAVAGEVVVACVGCFDEFHCARTGQGGCAGLEFVAALVACDSRPI